MSTKADEVRTRPGAPLEAVAAQLGADSAAEQQQITLGTDAQETQQAAPRRGRPPGSRNGTARKRPTTRAGREAEKAARAAGKAAQPESAAPAMPDMQAQVAIFAPILFVAMGAIINRKFPSLPYTMEEATTLATAAVPVAAKYGDSIVGQYAPEIALVSIGAMQVFTRVQHEAAQPAPLPIGRELVQQEL